MKRDFVTFTLGLLVGMAIIGYMMATSLSAMEIKLQKAQDDVRYYRELVIDVLKPNTLEVYFE